jgi:crossover junction endodeoxyribonuclease RuvC
LANTGWSVIEVKNSKIRYIDHGVITTKAETKRSDRLFFILKSILGIIDEYKPAEAAVETLYFGKNVTSAIPVAEARGVISAALAERSVFVYEFTPNTIKQGVTGTARADKKQVQEMVKIILGLDELPKPDHAADALAAAICAAHLK